MSSYTHFLERLGLRRTAQPVADGRESSAPAASREFLAACADTQKAWYQSNLLSICKQHSLRGARDALRRQSGGEIVELLLEVMGPVAPAKLKDAMGSVSNHHREMAKLVCSLAMRLAVAERQPGAMVDLAEVKAMLVHWIDEGSFGKGDAVAEDRQARRMASLLAGSEYADRVRLTIIAPLAPALESLIVVSKLSESMVSVMASTESRASHLGQKAGDVVKTAGPAGEAPGRPPFATNPVARAAAGEGN